MARKTRRVVLGEIVRKHRHQRGLSQEVLAERAEIHRTHISFIERGQRRPTLEVMWQIAQALDVPFLELMAEIDRAFPRALK